MKKKVEYVQCPECKSDIYYLDDRVTWPLICGQCGELVPLIPKAEAPKIQVTESVMPNPDLQVYDPRHGHQVALYLDSRELVVDKQPIWLCGCELYFPEYQTADECHGYRSFVKVDEPQGPDAQRRQEAVEELVRKAMLFLTTEWDIAPDPMEIGD